MVFDVDVGIGPGEAGGHPGLFLTPVLSVPERLSQILGQVVAQRAVHDPEDVRLVRADFLAQFAVEGRLYVLAGIDSALRHLPRAGGIDSLANENVASR